jgi:hypothetical protein
METLAPWIYELGAHMPKDVTLQVNFESGALKYQLDKPRIGGDYWLSYVGPSDRFARIAEAAAAHGTPMSAKLQVGCSHECATVSVYARAFAALPQVQRNARAAGDVRDAVLVFRQLSRCHEPRGGTARVRGFLRRGGCLSDVAGPPRLGRRCGDRRSGVETLRRGVSAFSALDALPVVGAAACDARLAAVSETRARTASAHVAGRRSLRRRDREALDNHTLAEAEILSRQMSEAWDNGSRW